MYEAFYGLKERPFNLTPDPRYLYLSEKHKEAFAHLLYGIKNRSGFVMVTGEIGTGKTTICRTLLGQLDPETEVAFIFNPSLSPVELLKKINEDFGIDSRAKTVKDLIDELNAYLLDRNAKGKNCVLVIDEAQNLTPSVLEQIRLLSNLESATQKLLQIVLIGQPELGELLELRELRQLNQRITARYHLKPLDFKETQQYLTYRLRVAGAHRRIHFSPAAMRVVYSFSKGTPRVINSVCDRALLIGYTQEASEISKDIARRAVKELKGDPVKRKREYKFLRHLIPNPTIVAVCILLLVAGKYVFDNIDRLPSRDADPKTDDPRIAAALTETESTRIEQPGIGFSISPEAILDEPITVEDMPIPIEPIVNTAPEAVDFSTVIDALDPEQARTTAAHAILQAWGITEPMDAPASDDPAAFTKFAAEHGMTAEPFTPSLSQLEAINLPAFVRLSTPGGFLWVALMGSDGERVRITTDTAAPFEVSKYEFMEKYLAEAVVLWRDPNPKSEALAEGMRSENIQILQAQLIALGRMEGNPTSYYGRLTTKAIMEIQRETGLAPDGIAGRQTRMVLSSWLPGFDTPALNPNGEKLMAAAEGTPNAAVSPESLMPADPDPNASQNRLVEPIPVTPVPSGNPAAPATSPQPQNESDTSAATPEAGAATVAPAKPATKAPVTTSQANEETFHEWLESIGFTGTSLPMGGPAEPVDQANPPAPQVGQLESSNQSDNDQPTGNAAESASVSNPSSANGSDVSVTEQQFPSTSIMPLVPRGPVANEEKSDGQ